MPPQASRGAPQHPSKLFKLRDMLLEDRPCPLLPRLSLHLSTRFRLYASLAIVSHPSRNNSSRIRVAAFFPFSPFLSFSFSSFSFLCQKNGVFGKKREREIGISFIETYFARGMSLFFQIFGERVKRFNFDAFLETCENRNNLKVR